MTEQEWLTTEWRAPMLDLMRERGDVRKLRLFAVACCWDRSHWLWEGPASRAALDVAELFADGKATPSELQDAQLAVYRQFQHNLYGGETVWDPTYYTCSGSIIDDVNGSAIYAANPIGMFPEPRTQEQIDEASMIEVRYQADLLRDIFGNPFRPIAFDPAWRSEAAVGIARGIYDDRAFERMPILADALQDAGCEHPDILAHCREPGTHVRGCWVVDLVLGKV